MGSGQTRLKGPPSLATLRREVRCQADPRRAAANRWYFKTGPGEYGEGDKFVGLTVPKVRVLAKTYRGLALADVQRLLRSPLHEERLLALFILVLRYSRAASAERAAIYRCYVKNLDRVNNWDLVDSSAPTLVGQTLAGREKAPLYRWIRSSNLWHRRIAILSTFYDIRERRFEDALRLAKILLDDKEDLLHKATGWMLREIAKRDKRVVVAFLKQHRARMPRTMLRYAIERFPKRERRALMG